MGSLGLSVLILGIITHFGTAQNTTALPLTNTSNTTTNNIITTSIPGVNATAVTSNSDPYSTNGNTTNGNTTIGNTTNTGANATDTTTSMSGTGYTTVANDTSEMPTTAKTMTARPATVSPYSPTIKKATPSSTIKPGPNPTRKPKSANTAVWVTLILVFVVLLGMAAAYFFLSRRTTRYSIDQHSRPDDAEIPLNDVDERSPDTASQNGTAMQTFSDSVETKEATDSEPKDTPEGQEEHKAESEDKPAADTSSTDPPASAPSADSDPGDKVVPEETSVAAPPPPEENSGEKTDDEGTSNQTSEDLKELNGNNSNNVIKTGTPGVIFPEVPLDSPV